jgi:hypothetical protein
LVVFIFLQLKNIKIMMGQTIGKITLAQDVDAILQAQSGLSDSMSEPIDEYKSYLNEEVTKELTMVKDNANLLYSRVGQDVGSIVTSSN